MSGTLNPVAVVIPTYKARDTILSVLGSVGPLVALVYVVDDACPHDTGRLVEESCVDARVRVIRNPSNLGVGGATMVGYRAAFADGAKCVVKIDSDGQMDPALIPHFVAPILGGSADYTKGNRFYNAVSISGMPKSRIFGNIILSFLTKISSGYWNIFDPTNGYTAIHASIIPLIPEGSVDKRFFFESDMLYTLGVLKAVVVDIPIVSQYGQEESNLSIRKIIGPFIHGHVTRFFRRVALNYFLRDFSLASMCLIFGTIFLAFGLIFGGWHWVSNYYEGVTTPVGTIMISTVSITIALQLILFFLSADIASAPTRVIHPLLERKDLHPLRQFPGRPPEGASAKGSG